MKIATVKTDTLDRVKGAAALIHEKKGRETRIYDVRTASNVTDYFLITSAYNQRHIKALCDELNTHLKRSRIIPIGREGITEGNWALIDCGDFVIHIFEPDSRQFYDLELIWGDVPQVEWEGDES